MGGLEQLRWAEAHLGPTVNLDDLAAERGEDVAVGRVARSGQGDAVTGIERGEEGEHEAAGSVVMATRVGSTSRPYQRR